MMDKVRKILVLLAGLCVSLLLVLSLPLIHFLSREDGGGKPRKVASQVTLTKINRPEKKEKPKRELKKPKPAKPSRTNLRSGPHFAMDLTTMGASGVGMDLDLTNKAGQGGAATGDVDVRPSPDFPPPFRLPREVKEREQDAYVLVSFCVDGSGRPYDLRIAEEKPPGSGMANAALEALRKTKFSPALKDGNPVSFCGLEQPFEVRFDG